jgi:hypothetical protein
MIEIIIGGILAFGVAAVVGWVVLTMISDWRNGNRK